MDPRESLSLSLSLSLSASCARYGCLAEVNVGGLETRLLLLDDRGEVPIAQNSFPLPLSMLQNVQFVDLCPAYFFMTCFLTRLTGKPLFLSLPHSVPC